MSNFKLPESAKAKVFVGFGVGVFNRGKISVGDFDISKHCSEGFETALVCETEMEFKFPSDFDPAAAYIGILEAKKQDINQEYSLRLVRINEKIAEARALPAPATKYPEEDFVSQADRYAMAMAMARGEV